MKLLIVIMFAIFSFYVTNGENLNLTDSTQTDSARFNKRVQIENRIKSKISKSLLQSGISLNDSSISHFSYSKNQNILSLRILGADSTNTLKLIPSDSLRDIFIDHHYVGNMKNGMGMLTLANGTISASNNIFTLMFLAEQNNVTTQSLSILAGGLSYFGNYFVYNKLNFDYGKAVEMYSYGKLALQYTYMTGVFFGSITGDPEDLLFAMKIASGASVLTHPGGIFLGYNFNLIDEDKPGNAFVKTAVSDLLFSTGLIIPSTLDIYEKKSYDPQAPPTMNSRAMVMAGSAIGLSLVPHIFSKQLFDGKKVSLGSGFSTMLGTYSGAIAGASAMYSMSDESDKILYGMLIGSASEGLLTYMLLKNYNYSVSSSLITIAGETLGGVAGLGAGMMTDNKNLGALYAGGALVTHVGLTLLLREPYTSDDTYRSYSFFNNIKLNPAALIPLAFGNKSFDLKSDFININF